MTLKICCHKNISIIEISDYPNIGSDYRYFKLVIRLTILIIDYRTALDPLSSSLSRFRVNTVLCGVGCGQNRNRASTFQLLARYKQLPHKQFWTKLYSGVTVIGRAWNVFCCRGKLIKADVKNDTLNS